MADQTLPIPTISGTIDQNFLIEPLGGPQNPISYLDRFPDELYNKAPESHFLRFIYTLLGPAGVGWLRKNYLEARLALEDYGLNLGDLDLFYGDPFKFGRVVDEQFDTDPTGLLTRAQWEALKTADTQYRNRIIDFLSGARLGNSPAGMHLIARSGLGYENQIFENYRYLYDLHSDSPAGLPYLGKTASTEEMIVMPRAEVPRSEEQTIAISGSPTGGNFSLVFNGFQSGPIVYTAVAAHSSPNLVSGIYQDVQSALEAIPTIRVGQVTVTGGPGPLNPFVVNFTGTLSNQDVPNFTVINSLTGDPTASVTVTTNVSAIESNQATLNITPVDGHNLFSALFRMKPMTTIPTLTTGPGTTARQPWGTVLASSQYAEVLRYVTGQSGVNWTLDSSHWIEANVEHEAPRVANDLQYHYQGFHNITSMSAYTDAALSDPAYPTTGPTAIYRSEHIGRFSPPQVASLAYLAQFTDDSRVFAANTATADYAEPLVVTTQNDNAQGKSIPYVNGIYPADYTRLSGVPQIQYRDEHFWSSRERPSGSDYLEIDLGVVQAVNFIAFEVTKKPIDITVNYDLLDQGPARLFTAVTPVPGIPYPSSIVYTPEEQSPWYYVELNFTNSIGNIPFSRYIRLQFARRISANMPFLFDLVNNVQNPWSVEVRNVRVGRNVTNPS